MNELDVPAARLYKIMPPERLDSLEKLEFRFTPREDLNDPYDLMPSTTKLREDAKDELLAIAAAEPPPKPSDFLAVFQRYVFDYDFSEIEAALVAAEGNLRLMAFHSCFLIEGFEQTTRQVLEDFGVFSLTRIFCRQLWGRIMGVTTKVLRSNSRGRALKSRPERSSSQGVRFGGWPSNTVICVRSYHRSILVDCKTRMPL